MPESGPGPSHIIIVAAISAGLAVVAVLVLLAVRLGMSPDTTDDTPQLSVDSTVPGPEDMLLPDPRLEAQVPRPRLLRVPRGQWSAGDVQRFWIDPADISREYLRDRAEEQINTLFGVGADGELQ